MKSYLAIVRTELWQRRWALVWWSIGIAALISIDMLLYKSLKAQASDIDKAFSNLPAAFQALFSANANFLSPTGFLSARIYYLLLPLLLTIFSINMAAGLIAKEEDRGTLELLLSRPVSRTKLLLAKLSAAIVAKGILAFVALVTALLCLKPSGIETVSAKAIAVTTLYVVLLSALFGMIAFCFSALGKPLRSFAVGVASLVAFGSYLIASLESIATWLRWPAKLVPYHYYNPNVLLAGGRNKWTLLGYVVVLLTLLIISVIGFRRRDIGN